MRYGTDVPVFMSIWVYSRRQLCYTCAHLSRWLKPNEQRDAHEISGKALRIKRLWLREMSSAAAAVHQIVWHQLTNPLALFHIGSSAEGYATKTCPWRIDKITRRLESGTTLDSAFATRMNRNLLGM